MFVEKRKYPRVYYNLPIKLYDSEFDIVTETKNISGNGAYCMVNRPIPPMTKLKIILLVPLIKKNNQKTFKKVNCGGVVVRQEFSHDNGKRHYNIGIFFNDIKDKDRKAITSYINSLLAQPTN